MKDFNKKVLTLVLIITFTFSPTFAVPAQAQWVDISTAAKDYGLDGLAWTLVDRTIKRITASTVNWINSGFQGSPAYVTDPEAYFLDIADKVAGQYITKNLNLDYLCGPISAKIRIALARNYTGDYDRWSCTLTEVGRNMEDFMSDFSNGGWDSFFQISQTQHMSPIGAYLQAENEMFQQIESKTNQKLKELDWGQGFMSYEVCRGTQDPDGFCNGYLETVTPGSVINNKLNEALGSGTKRLEAADEINEIVSALLNQLLSQVFSATGLAGTSRSSASNNNQSLVDRIRTSDDLTGYFGEIQDTSVLDVPPPGTEDSGTTPTPSYTIDQLLTSANSLSYDSTVTAAQMNAIRNLWVANIAAGTVTDIYSGSVLAYMLGWGGLPEGTVMPVSGTTMTYQLNTGTWVLQ